MRYIIIAILVLSCGLCYGDCVINLSKEQRTDLDVINQACKAQYPAFRGFYSMDNGIKAVGVNDSAALQLFVDSVSIPEEKKKDPQRKALKQVRNKLKVLGLDNGDLKTMGLDNDISD